MSLCGCGFCKAAMRTNAVFVPLTPCLSRVQDRHMHHRWQISKRSVAKLDLAQRRRYGGTPMDQAGVVTRNRTSTGPCDLQCSAVLRGLFAAVTPSPGGALLSMCNIQAFSASALKSPIRPCRTPTWPVAGASVYQHAIWFRGQSTDPGFYPEPW